MSHSQHLLVPLAVIALFAGAIVYGVFVGTPRLRRNRERFIREYSFPIVVRRKLARRNPEWTGEEIENALTELRRFFLRCLEASPRSEVRMTSKPADDAWHEFILCTREYAAFSRKAFGRYLHHRPDGEAAIRPTKLEGGSALAACGAFYGGGSGVSGGCSGGHGHGGHGCSASGCSGSCGGGGCSSS